MSTNPQTPTQLRINRSETFHHLANAPIVEAVIQINAKVRAEWSEARLVQTIQENHPKFTKCLALNDMTMNLVFNPPSSGQSDSREHGSLPPVTPVAADCKSGFAGLRMETSDGRWIAQFHREFLALSQLAPYGDWGSFCRQAIEVWEQYAALGNVDEVTRVSSRFINRIEVPLEGLDVGHYFRGFGESPAGFPVAGFLHQTVLVLPETPYKANLIRTHLPPSQEGSLPLILDLDAFSDEQTTRSNARIEEKLADLRWIKNKVFFESVTDQLLELCGKPTS